MSETPTATRREMLRLAAASAPAAAAALVGGTAVQAAAPEAGEGLRRTAHVAKYLETARF